MLGRVMFSAEQSVGACQARRIRQAVAWELANTQRRDPPFFNVSSDKGVTNAPNPIKSDKEKEKEKGAGGKGASTKVESKGEAEGAVGLGIGEDKGEVITGLGAGEPSPVTPGRSRPHSTRIRPRVSSVGSADLRVANTDLWRREEKKVGICINEIEEYVAANFSKEKHGSYLGARFKKIKDSMEYLEQEFEKVARLAGRVASLEERLAGAARKIDDLQEHVIDGVSEVVKTAVEEAMGRAVERLVRKGSEDRELWVRTMEDDRKELVEMEKRLKERIDRRAKDDREALGRALEGERKELGKVEERLKAKVDTSVGRVVKRTEEVEKGVTGAISESAANVCQQFNSFGREINKKMEVIGLQKQEEPGVNIGVTVEQVEEVIRRVVGESKKEGDRSGVPGPSGVPAVVPAGSPWAEVVKKGRSRGPRVALKLGEGSVINRKDLREKLMTAVGGREADVRIRGVWREGTGLAMELHDEEEAEKLKAKVGEVGIRVENLRGLEPKIKLEGVEEKVDKQDLAAAIWAKNASEIGGNKEEFIRDFKVVRSGSGPCAKRIFKIPRITSGNSEYRKARYFQEQCMIHALANRQKRFQSIHRDFVVIRTDGCTTNLTDCKTFL
ncbi:hypothetical protein GE061_020193 [Apolygus lucorum]|uniref:Uncharacterized protein n=1 Tax=Apolygus lucorum TaxID=248454 RepID=A0A8S9WMA5_APOLU|nr:hypothetical protein GE061_020193 [Apolygus lucorum]